jgi:hypothetical protein
MANIVKGDDFSPDGRRSGFAVLGTSSPSTIKDQGGNDEHINSVGVFGVVGDDVGSVSEFIDDIENNFGQTITAGVAGAVILKAKEGVLPETDALGYLGGNDRRFNQPTGVYGESSQQGVVGISKGPAALGVLGMANQSGTNNDPATGGTGVLGSGYIGVRGETQTGVAVLGRTFGPGLAGLFSGGKVLVQSDLEVAGDVLLHNSDVAEQFAAVAECVPGSVMVIAENGLLEPCTRDYDKRAVGIISGAGSLRPAITLGHGEAETPAVPIAMVGTALCLVDAEKAPIEIGDLLTSSSAPGHAMKALDQIRSFGAVIGKALASLSHGRGLVPVLVSLQ